jgi:hypothetical protein
MLGKRYTKLVAVLAVVAVTLLQGCAAIQQDPRDAAWDPKGGAQLFEQIPPWDGHAGKVCCGHLRSCAAHQTPRC